jgi:hypothetical protein
MIDATLTMFLPPIGSAELRTIVCDQENGSRKITSAKSIDAFASLAAIPEAAFDKARRPALMLRRSFIQQ